MAALDELVDYLFKDSDVVYVRFEMQDTASHVRLGIISHSRTYAGDVGGLSNDDDWAAVSGLEPLSPEMLQSAQRERERERATIASVAPQKHTACP